MKRSFRILSVKRVRRPFFFGIKEEYYRTCGAKYVQEGAATGEGKHSFVASYIIGRELSSAARASMCFYAGGKRQGLTESLSSA